LFSYLSRAELLLHRINALAAISEDADGITRTFGTPAFVRGRDLVQGWMAAAGLATRLDSIGNLRARLSSPNPRAKTLVIGSHIDTVVNAGRFDGPLGVLLGLAIMEHLQAQNRPLPCHVELMAFSDEEGVRFHTTYLGSKVVAGTFDESLLPKRDATGVTLAEALAGMGGDAAQIPHDALPAAEWLGYFEVHIEQGPVLYERHVPVALVTGIAGQHRVELTWLGMAGHAGTVPMPMRQDALAAAAEFVLAAEALARASAGALVATVGKLEVRQSASNVIPGLVTCSLDLRSADATHLEAAYHELRAQAEALATRRRLHLTWSPVQQTAPVACDRTMNALLAEAIADSGYEVIPLVSGAGHDAVPISAVAPATMLFVRCFQGISHNPLENVEMPDLAAALQVAERFVELLLARQQA